VGEGVAEGPVGEQEIVKSSLREDITDGDRGRGAAAGWGPELATKFETLKETTPDGIGGGGVGLPLFVELFELLGVAGVAESAQCGGRGGGRAVGIQTFEGRQGWIRFGRGLEIANHDFL